MSKVEVTKKSIINAYENILKIGYCNLQYLLQFENPLFYTANRYGWRSDIYVFGGTAISTGYEPFGNIEVPYELQEEYDTKAEKIVHNHDIDNAEKEKQLHGMIDEFLEKALNKDRKQEEQAKADWDTVPEVKAAEAPDPDTYVTGEYVRTPRGSFSVTDMTVQQMEEAGYGFHHESDDGQFLIMGNGTQAYAIANSSMQQEMSPQRRGR